MGAMLMDTHAIIKRLIAVGMPEAQAEEVTRAVHSVALPDTTMLVTREDFRALAATVASMQLDIEWIKKTMATKEELAKITATMATKEELAEMRQEIAYIKATMATKDELAEVRQEIAYIKTTMATKEELVEVRQEITHIKATMATKEDLIPLATKEELVRLSAKMATKDDLEMLRRDMTIKLGAMLLGFASLIVLAIRYLTPISH